MSHPLVAFLEQLRNAFARETLPPPPTDAPRRRAGAGFARLLFSIEALPLESPVARPPRRGVLSLLLAAEPLAREPAPAPRRRGRSVLAALFAPEPLPLEPALPPRRRHTRWLSWLFVPERIDRDPNPPEVR
jgi:hypothetical protein